jgi:hypothetical protein
VDLEVPKAGALSVSLIGILLLALPSISSVVLASSNQATFSGTASVHLVGKDSTGKIVTMMLAGVSFTGTVKPGGPGVGSMDLNLLNIMDIPGVVATGRIVLTSNSVSGGGTEAVAPMGSQFALSVSARGGQVECLMAGFSAGFEFGGLTVLQMDVHGTVPSGDLTIG